MEQVSYSTINLSAWNRLLILPNTLDIRDFSPSSWRDLIGVVPQDPILFTGTIASNIALSNPDATRDEIEEAARQANCEFVWGMPRGFDTESARPRFVQFHNWDDS